MTLVLFYLAALGLVSARWLARQGLTTKPWLSAGPPVAPLMGGPAPAMIGLGFFLAAVGLLFALLIAAHAMRVPPDAARVALDPRLLWLTTGLLATASLALHLAGAAVRRGDVEMALASLLASGAATLVFLGGQCLAWRLLWEAGAGREAADVFFYLITALHGLHLVGGLFGLARVTLGAARAVRPTRLQRGIALCTLYWDALLVIWLALFGLLFRTPWSGLIDALCGPA